MSQERKADQIAKLLRKAESVAGTPEADAFVRKAQELRVTWAIDEAMLAKARGVVEKVREEIIEKRIEYKGVYHRAQYRVGSVAAEASDCRVLVSKGSKWTCMYVIGFESDVVAAELLDASLQIQCAQALNNWWKQQDSSWKSAMEKFKDKREFIYGFADGVSTQLWRANDDAKKAAAKNEADRSDVDIAEATNSVGLVLVEKSKSVDDWVDKTYGRLKAGRRTSRSRGSYNASGAGRKAGSTANVGRDSITGGSRKALA